MNIRDRATLDSDRLLVADGVPVTLTFPSGDTTQTAGQVNRIGSRIDPDTGALVLADQTAITVPLSAFGDQEIVESIIAETTDATGKTVRGRISMPMPDRSLGRVTFFLKVIA